jgi:acetyl-CoA synthetase
MAGDRRRDRDTTSTHAHGGILVIKRPWPAMIRTIWGDPSATRSRITRRSFGGKLYTRR